MKDIFEKENPELLEALSNKASQPDLDFKKDLKQAFLEDFKPKTAPQRGFFGLSDRQLNFMSFSLVLFAGVIFGAGLIYVNISNNNLSNETIAAVPTDKQKEILSNVIKKNPDNLILKQVIQDNATAAADLPSNTLNGASILTSPVAQEVKEFTYSETNSTDTAGPMVAVCGEDRITNEIVTNFQNYFDGSGYAISKLSTTNGSDEIINYLISEQNGEAVTSTIYRGGDYAVSSTKTVEKQLTPVSAPNANVSDSVIEEYFGNDLENIGTKSEDGKEFYIIISEKNIECKNEVKKLLTRHWIDQESFAIVKTENFLTKVDAKNLINTIRTTTTVTSSPLEEVKDKFNFDYDVPVVDYQFNRETYINLFKEFYSDKNIVIPANEELENAQIVLNEEALPHLQDPNFYSDSELGEKLFSNELANNPLFIIKMDYSNLEIKVYNKNVKTELLTSAKLSKTTVEVDGKKIDAQMSRGPVSFPNNKPLVIFERGSFKYNIGFNSEVKNFKEVSISVIE